MNLKTILLSFLLTVIVCIPAFSALESLTGGSVYINSLVNTNPVGATDPKSEGDDHIRGIKNVILNTFPGITGAVTSTHTELNLLDGVTSSTAELNIVDGVTATASEINYNDITTAGTAEASKSLVLDGSKGITGITSLTGTTVTGTTVTGTTVNASTTLQIGGTSVTSTAAELNIVDGVTATAAEINKLDVSAETVTNYTSGVLTFIRGDTGSEATQLNVNTAVTENTWESIGPTGSSATNIWTAMDSITSDATFIILKISISIQGATNTDTYQARLNARKTGDTTAKGTDLYIAHAIFVNRSGATEQTGQTVTAYVPVDASGRFDVLWEDFGTTPTTSIDIRFVGWGE